MPEEAISAELELAPVPKLPRRRSKQEQREDSIARILDAAERLFITKGFHATRTEEIGAAAGLTKGALYFHFGEKTAVLLALLERVQSRVLDPLAWRLASGQGTPLDRLRDFLLQQARLAHEEPAMLLLPIIVSIEFADTDQEPGKRVRWGYQRTAELLAQVIEEGQAQGLFRRDMTPRQQASLILALNDGVMLEWWRSEPRTTGRSVVDAVYGLLMSGIRVVAAAPAETRPAQPMRNEK